MYWQLIGSDYTPITIRFFESNGETLEKVKERATKESISAENVAVLLVKFDKVSPVCIYVNGIEYKPD